jgi:GT2 family glycosyltransferase
VSQQASLGRLAVVILTWNRRDDTLACLDSLQGEVGDGDVVIVCDNGSEDGTEAAIRSQHPWVEFIQNGANLGFAGGNNPGLRSALKRDFEWVLLLNNDTTVPEKTLSPLLAHAASRPAVGAFQPLIVEANDGTRIDSAGQSVLRRVGTADSLMGRPIEEAPQAPVPVFGACAAAALLRASALRGSGLLDEELFAICEDADLMFRLRLAGWEVELVPHLRVLHKRGISVGATSRESTRARRFWIDRNVVALGLRYWPTKYIVTALPRLAFRSLRARRGERRMPGHRCYPLWRDSCGARRANRRAMRRLCLDHWFQAQPTGEQRR